MSEEKPGANWKLDLRHGRLRTPYAHYSVIADGVVGELQNGFTCRSGPAYMGMKTWYACPEESTDMARTIGADLGFTVTGRVQVYETEPTEPPREDPYAYEIQFTAYEADDDGT